MSAWGGRGVVAGGRPVVHGRGVRTGWWGVHEGGVLRGAVLLVGLHGHVGVGGHAGVRVGVRVRGHERAVRAVGGRVSARPHVRVGIGVGMGVRGEHVRWQLLWRSRCWRRPLRGRGGILQ